jgi:cysteine dioxygenase
MRRHTAPLVTIARRPLAQLLHDLRALGDLRARPPVVDALLDGVALSVEALLPSLPFATGGYTRTLVWRDDRFELIVAAWSPGSASPVHDHDGQDCWFVPLAGSFDLADYALIASGRHRAHLVPMRARRVGAGELDRRDARESVHAVTPVTPLAVSLHVYAQPIDRCRVYDLSRGMWRWQRLRYDAFAYELGA